MTDRTRFVAERIVLVLLGPLTILAMSAVSPLFGRPFLTMGLAFGLAALIAGLIEVAATRRTGRRRPIGAWLPTILGMLVTGFIVVATGPRGPDSGLADGILIMAALVITPLFALAVTLVATIGLKWR